MFCPSITWTMNHSSFLLLLFSHPQLTSIQTSSLYNLKSSIKQQLSYSYFATYQHMGPYCLGIFIGYLLYKRPKIQLPKHLTWLLWLLLPPLSFTTLLLTYLWNGAYEEESLINPSPLVSAFYVAIHRTIWSSLLAWIVFACATGRAKLMSNFLSHSIFVPLSRLSFSIYLVHLPVIMFRALNLRHTVEWTDSNILWEACGNFVASLVIGYFVNVAFESPFINLERFIMRRGEDASKDHRRANTMARQSGADFNIIACQQDHNGINDEREEVAKVAKTTLTHTTTTSGCSSESYQSEQDVEDKKSSASSSEDRTKQFTRGGGQQQQIRNNQENEENKRRKSFGPKQNFSVEKIFGQMEPQQLSQDEDPYDDNTTSQQMAAATAAADSESTLRRQQLAQRKRSIMDPSKHLDYRRGPARRYSMSYETRSALGGTSSRSAMLDHPSTVAVQDSLYPISSGEFENFSRESSEFANTNQNRPLSGLRYLRQRQLSCQLPPQYATLARSSRISYDSHHYQTAAQFGDFDNYQQQASNMYGVSKKTSSHLSEPISSSFNLAGQPQAGAQNDASFKNYHQQLAVIRRQQQQQSRRLLLQAYKRPGRYNTLTGVGSRELRQHEFNGAQQHRVDEDLAPFSRNSFNSGFLDEVDENNSWNHHDHHQQLDFPLGNESLPVGQGRQSWLQPGALIPRIDSSALRRNVNANTSSSIIPESTGDIVEEEREDSISEESADGKL